MDLHLFDQVELLLSSVCPEELGALKSTTHRYGIKVWFDTPDAPRGHYEAQILGRRHIDGKDGMAVEIGFHAEYRDEAENEAAVDCLMAKESQWRPILGDETEAGPFFGRASWRRVSDAWIDPDLSEPDTADEIAHRLVDYLTAFEPVLRGG